jgi:hypothetical protein
MVMFLMAACMSLFGLAVLSLAFGAATRGERSSQPAAPEPRPSAGSPLPPQRFFADHGEAVRPPTAGAVPFEALLLQIEQHIRLEQAAAESFLNRPSSESLHERTQSPLGN